MKQLHAYPLTHHYRALEKPVAVSIRAMLKRESRLTHSNDLSRLISLTTEFSRLLNQHNVQAFQRFAYAVPFMSQRALWACTNNTFQLCLEGQLAAIRSCFVGTNMSWHSGIAHYHHKVLYFTDFAIHDHDEPFDFSSTTYDTAYAAAMRLLNAITTRKSDTVWLPIKFYPFCNLLFSGYRKDATIMLLDANLRDMEITRSKDDILGIHANDYQMAVFKSNYDLLKLCGDVESNPGPRTFNALNVDNITLCAPIKIPSDDDVGNIIDTLFSKDIVYNIFQEYALIDPSTDMPTATLFELLCSREAELTTLRSQFALADECNSADRFLVSEKLTLSIALGVNLVIIDHENNKAYLTRTCNTDETLCLLVSKSVGTDSVRIPFQGEHVTYLRYVSRVTTSSEILHALFPGETLKIITSKTFFETPSLSVFTEDTFDYAKGTVTQLLIPNKYDTDSIVKTFNVPRVKWTRFDVIAGKNEIYPPRPQIYGSGPLNDEQAKKYAKASIRIFNKACPEHEIKIPVIHTDDEIINSNKAARYYYPTSHAGTSIINHKQCAGDAQRLAPLFGSTPKKLFSKYVSQTNGVFLLSRIYVRELDNEVFDSGVIYVTLRVGNDGIGTHVILTTSYLERICQSMLVNHVYKIERINGRLSFVFLEVEGLVSAEDEKRDLMAELGEENPDILRALYSQVIKIEREIARHIGNVLKEMNIVNGRAIMKRSDFRLVMHDSDGAKPNQLSLNVNRFSTINIPTFSFDITVKSEIEYGVPLYIRDSLAPRIKRRLMSTKQEQNLSSDEALEINPSYRTMCEARYPLEVFGDQVRLPCGMITTVDNPMLHKHSCTIGLHALTRSEQSDTKLRIHSAFKCGKCNRTYNNNIIAQRCARLH
uniref:Uncharacterized protein n=1 Tax=Operophtera brumata cypovirus 18 TaxID=352244 RepID=Q30C75_9REOV|nr:unknown [Operophtera brumata cypovirus 18]